MDEIINFVLSFLAFSFYGTICLFSWVLASNKEEIWDTILEKDGKDE